MGFAYSERCMPRAFQARNHPGVSQAGSHTMLSTKITQQATNGSPVTSAST